MRKLTPWIFIGLAALWVFSGMRDASLPATEMRLDEFAKIPVIMGGRVKPLDTVARTHLRILSNRETFKDEKGVSRPAIRWLIDVQTDSADDEARGRKDAVFRIDHPQLRDALGLKDREGYRYSIEEFGSKVQALMEPLKGAHDRKESGKPVDAFENQLLEFERHLGIFQKIAAFSFPHLIPPAGGKEWRTLSEASKVAGGIGVDAGVDAWWAMLTAYGKNDVAKFNSAVAAYRAKLAAERPDDVRRAELETRFNTLDAFNTCKWIYLLGFVLCCVSWLGWAVPLNWAAWGMLSFTAAVHTGALITRIYLSGRPPVTNLYSSAVFIGWGAVIGGLLLAQILRRSMKSPAVMSLGTAIAAIAGFLTLQIAHILAADGDTMEVLQAVLDTQFWLATHVTCITLGYTTTYLAGLLGVTFILMGVLTRSLTPALASLLTRMTYGVVCFATFFSFIGTVLGGLWADDSWGRFWGWDPKENGALMIVLWNALLLHARWGGLVRERGIAVLAVMGNIVVSWSWFGVNQLGVGLHSYGFTNGVAVALVAVALSQFAIMGLGLIPMGRWKSRLPVKGASAEEA